MSEVIEPKATNASPGRTTSLSTSTRLRELSSGSEWVSPFRTGTSKLNLHRQMKEENSIKNIHVPKKFTEHPTLKAHYAKSVSQKKVESKPKGADENLSTITLSNEPIDTPKELSDQNGEIRPGNEEAEEAEGKEATEATEATETTEVTEATEVADAADANDLARDTEEKEVTGAPVMDALATANDDEQNTTSGQEYELEEEVKGDNESERPLSESEKAELEDTENLEDDAAPISGEEDENIVEEVKEVPVEIVTQPETKFIPVNPPDQETLDKFKDKPVLLNHYQQLNSVAVNSASRSLNDPNKLIDLGSGLKVTQQNLLEVAARRVGPILASIDDEVSKTRNEDKIKKQNGLAIKVAHQGKKLQGHFDNYMKKLEKKKGLFSASIESKLSEYDGKITTADKNAAEFEANTKNEMEEAQKDFKQREEEALKKHEDDKITLGKNHEELLETKKQELEDCKTSQETTTQEIEELQEKKIDLDNKNYELSNKIETLSEEFNEKNQILEELKAKHDEHTDAYDNFLTNKSELDDKRALNMKAVEEKRATHAGVAAEVGALSATLSAYATKLADLNNINSSHNERLEEAKQRSKEWEDDKERIAIDVAREWERKRIETEKQAEEKRIEEERKRKAEELAREEEAQRIAQEAAAKEEEDNRVGEELVQKEEEKHERIETERKQRLEAQKLENDLDHQLMLRIERRQAEQKALELEREQNERWHLEKNMSEMHEITKLQDEIDELHEMQAAREAEAMLAAQDLEAKKLEQIEKLKLEHDERVKFFQDRLNFENLQKERLVQEVENLRKIRELREEKARLTAELSDKSDSHRIKQMIDARETELAHVSKQIEFDNLDYNRLRNPYPGSSSISVSGDGKELTSEVTQPKNFVSSGKGEVPGKTINQSGSATPTGAIGFNVGAETAENSSNPVKLSSISGGMSKLKSFGQKLKRNASLSGPSKQETNDSTSSLGKKASTSKEVKETANSNPAKETANSNPDKETANSNPAKETANSNPAKETANSNPAKETANSNPANETANSNPAKQTANSNPAKETANSNPAKETANSNPAKETSTSYQEDQNNSEGSEYEVYSMYEEISDSDFERNKSNPDYLELSSEEFNEIRHSKII